MIDWGSTLRSSEAEVFGDLIYISGQLRPNAGEQVRTVAPLRRKIKFLCIRKPKESTPLSKDTVCTPWEYMLWRRQSRHNELIRFWINTNK